MWNTFTNSFGYSCCRNIFLTNNGFLSMAIGKKNVSQFEANIWFKHSLSVCSNLCINFFKINLSLSVNKLFTAVFSHHLWCLVCSASSAVHHFFNGFSSLVILLQCSCLLSLTLYKVIHYFYENLFA